VIERSIAAATHGRYLVSVAAFEHRAPLLVGFHGYAEAAEAQIERLRNIPGAERWLVVSIQGLNRFYQRRTDEVIAGWMTRQDRELAIADNLRYVAAVVDAVIGEHAVRGGAVYAGFSQGVAMAFRAAAASTRPVGGVIAVGGDVPPEIGRDSLARIGTALLCRGSGDDWYTAAAFQKDADRLRAAGVSFRALEFPGGHEWSAPVQEAAAAFLRERNP
jgi:predicted esterase